jgi:threonine/homoserine/homoserine lactone efflux protein
MLFYYLSLGAISGFFSSTPLGPINLWVAEHRLSKSPRSQLLTFLVAVILVDIAFATIALWGQFELLEEKAEVRWSGLLSSTFTAILGIVFLIKARRPPTIHHETKHQAGNWSAFVQGLILTGANPAFLLFWLFVANQILSRLDTALSTMEQTSFGMGVLLGDVLWFSFFSWAVSRLRQKTQDKTLRRLRMSVGLIITILGLIGIGTYVTK